LSTAIIPRSVLAMVSASLSVLRAH
jgi:hypothetical protein